MGAFLRPDELARHVARINALAPDLVCITGDLVDRAATCDEAFPVLAGLTARHGVVVTLGNHDVAAGAEAVTAALRRLTPFTVLRNARFELERDGARLAVVGVDDLGRDWARGVLEHPALPGLARDVAPATPLVVLTHRPDCFEQAARLGADLVLAGHTHGGQIGLPSWRGRRVRNPAAFITRYDRGTFRSGTATLIVSNGLGFTGQPVRLFTPRQIGCVELHPA
jgi:predicted MPP superfamily phosphohydrolase